MSERRLCIPRVGYTLACFIVALLSTACAAEEWSPTSFPVEVALIGEWSPDEYARLLGQAARIEAATDRDLFVPALVPGEGIECGRVQVRMTAEGLLPGEAARAWSAGAGEHACSALIHVRPVAEPSKAHADAIARALIQTIMPGYTDDAARTLEPERPGIECERPTGTWEGTIQYDGYAEPAAFEWSFEPSDQVGFCNEHVRHEAASAWDPVACVLETRLVCHRHDGSVRTLETVITVVEPGVVEGDAYVTDTTTGKPVVQHLMVRAAGGAL